MQQNVNYGNLPSFRQHPFSAGGKGVFSRISSIQLQNQMGFTAATGLQQGIQACLKK